MKRFFVVALSLLALTATAGPKQAPPASTLASDVTTASVDAFRSLVNEASSPEEWTHVRLHAKTGKWNKQYFKRGVVKYDVVKTDSLISPAKGLSTFSVEARQSEGFDSREQAASSETLSPVRLTYFFNNQYVLIGGKWALEQTSYQVALGERAPDPTTFTATRDAIVNDSAYGAGLSVLLGKWVK